MPQKRGGKSGIDKLSMVHILRAVVFGSAKPLRSTRSGFLRKDSPRAERDKQQEER
jgi:hypothetical protein